MALVAGASAQDLRPAEVHFGYLGKSSEGVFRSGEECLVDPNALAPWGWSVSVGRTEADVLAEGTRVKAPVKTINGRKLVPLQSLLESLSIGHGWRPNTNEFEVWGQIRLLKAMDGHISVDSSLPAKPKVFTLKQPDRIVIDLTGVRLTDKTQIELGPGSRAAQYKPDIVRIVISGDNLPTPASFNPSATRRFEYSLSSGSSDPAIQIPVRVEEDPPVPPVDAVPPLSPVTNPVRVGSPAVLSENATILQLKVPLSRALPSPMILRRPEAATLELILPGGSFEVAEGWKSSSPSLQTVEAFEVAGGAGMRLTLARPMGVELTALASEILITLHKPKVGDGRLAGKTIVVDAGHGGHDPGARSPAKDASEKNLTLAISKQLAQKLAEQGATVIMTRKTDVFIALKERAEIANRNNADIFVSIHINSNGKANSTSGGMTFYHKKSPIGYTLADCVQREIAKVSKIPSLGVWSDQRIYDSGFAVLRYSKMPAILIEMGFINHQKDRARMVTKDFQEQVAEAIVRGLKVFLGDGKAKTEEE